MSFSLAITRAFAKQKMFLKLTSKMCLSNNVCRGGQLPQACLTNEVRNVCTLGFRSDFLDVDLKSSCNLLDHLLIKVREGGGWGGGGATLKLRPNGQALFGKHLKFCPSHKHVLDEQLQ